MSTVLEKAKITTKHIDSNRPKISVIARNEIPFITEIEHEGKIEQLSEVRDFNWHDQLKAFLPFHNAINLSWVNLKPGKVLEPHVHSIQSMVIICEGEGQLTGDGDNLLKTGDVVAIPAGAYHGFKTTDNIGFKALSIQFGEGLYTDPDHPRTSFIDDQSSFESLEKLNQEFKTQFTKTRMMQMLTDGTLENKQKRQRYVDALQIWSNLNQDLLFTRQGAAADEPWASMYLEHFWDEVGHHKMHANRNEAIDPAIELTSDPVIEAIHHWFIHQMLRRDNIVKTALVHLVIENGSHVFHAAAKPVLSKTVNEEYYTVHEADTAHAEMGAKLLRHLSASQYKELHPVIKKGWEMLFAMTDRVCYLVDQV